MLRKTSLLMLIAALGLLAVIGLSQGDNVEANNLGLSETVFATDVVAAGFGGIRNIGTGSLTVTGVSGKVTRAYLYWMGPTNSTSATANASVIFNGSAVTGTNIGFSDDNCWGFVNSQAYRADVTSMVPGNGTYSLANFLKSDANINGVSLIVFFNDSSATNNRDIVLFHGNDSNIPNTFDADGWNVTLGGINYKGGAVSLDLHVADGQGFFDAALILNGATLAPSGAVFQGDTVPNGASAGSTNGGLWDIRSFSITGSLSIGTNTLTLTSGLNNDCLALVVAIVNLPAGAAPGQPSPTPTATPAITNSFILGAVGQAAGRQAAQNRAVQAAPQRPVVPPVTGQGDGSARVIEGARVNITAPSTGDGGLRDGRDAYLGLAALGFGAAGLTLLAAARLRAR